MPASRKRVSIRIALVAALIALVAGCASTATRDPRDPFEPLNRGVYQFNDALDRAIMKPVAEGYRFVVPSFVRSSVSNFFSNLNDVVVALNNLLQGKFTAFVNDFGRIAMNSTLGMGGLFDVASQAGMEKHDEDFGQTLGVWGVADGPFLMLPIFGPSNVRDTIGRVADLYIDPLTYVYPYRVRNTLWGVKFVNRRAELLDAGRILETAALDPYEFIRDAYLQRRRNLIYDGNPPANSDDLNAPAPRGAATSRKLAAADDITEVIAQASSRATPPRDELDEMLRSLPPVTAPRRTARATVIPAAGL